MRARSFPANKAASIRLRDLSPLSLLMLTNRAIFSPLPPSRPAETSAAMYSCGGEVTRYFTLFFELDSFPLAIITTSFGPVP
jgi:hypothetical protein